MLSDSSYWMGVLTGAVLMFDVIAVVILNKKEK